MIRIHSLTKRYGSTMALDGLDLSVGRGEIFGFLGPNGAGKTTTVKILAGIIRPTGGTAVLGGHDILADPLAAKRITGYIPDSPFLYEKLNGLELLKFTAGMYGMDDRTADRRAAALLERFALADRSNELIEGYSHGMRQKLVFCAALLIDPEILVVDEPMVGLDPKSNRMVREILRELSSRGKTVFMSTHSLGVAAQVSDRIGIIQKGRLRALGTMAELRRLAGTTRENLEEIFLTLTHENVS